MAREFFRHFLSALVLVGALPLFTSVAQAALSVGQEASVSPPSPAQSILDLVVVPGPDDTPTIFVADASGAIYARRLTGEGATRFDLREFAPFFRSSEFPAPAALAYRNGKLIVSDQKAGVVFELDIKTRRPNVLLYALKAPTSVAVSELGTIAVGDASLRRVLWYDPGKDPRAPDYNYKVLDYDYSDPGRLMFAGNELLALNKKTGVITPLAAPGAQASQTAQSQNTVDRFRRAPFNEVVDLAFYRGIYYVAGRQQIVAHARASGTTSPPMTFESPSLVAVTDSHLFVVNSARKSIWKRPRLASVSVSFEIDPKTKISPEQQKLIHQEALAALYLYLHAQKILPLQKVEPRQLGSHSILQQLLFAHNVLLPIWNANPSSPNLLTEQARENLEKLFCYLNVHVCLATESEPRARFTLKIEPGDKIQLPDIPFKRDLTTSAVLLNGKSVKEHLSLRVSPEQRAKLDTNSLWKSNTQLRKTTEGVLSSQGVIIPDSLRGSLQPGTLLTFQTGREVILGDLNKCDPNLQGKITVQPASLPTTTLSYAAEAVLPWQTDQLALRRNEARKLGIAKVEVSFDKTTVARLDPEVVEAALRRDLATLQCFMQQTQRSPSAYLVTEVLTADQARYRFRRKDGSLKTLTKEEQERTNLVGQADPTGEWSWIAAGPLNIGYRLWDLNTSSGAAEAVISNRLSYPNTSLSLKRWKQVADPASVKPDTAQNILSQTEGEVELPATRWRLSVFVNVEDLRLRGSALRQTVTGPGVYLFSEEENRASKAGSDEAAFVGAPCLEDLTLEQIREMRKELKKKINYLPPGPGISATRIGIGEDAGSVHPSHQDFSDENGGAWYQEDGDSDLSPLPRPASAAMHGSPLIKKFIEERDHGNHVAGLLAGRENERSVPGLLPSVGLFLINYKNPAGLDSEAGLDKVIENAIRRGVYIFNFSFTIDRDDTMDSLKEKMGQAWAKKLFVVAAGNNFKDVKNMRERVAISWADDLPNIIGVGASDDSGNLLAPWAPDPTRPSETIPGSNWGKQHVHLLAPGKEILSAASENKYACASGTSMAVPQVVAAAATLSDLGLGDVPWIKARLIYTADWGPQLINKVWGGQLNYGRAVRQHNLNLLVTQTNPNPNRYSLLEFEDNLKIEVINGDVDDPRGDQVDRPKKIAFKDILRIQRLSEPYAGRFRVIYLEGSDSKRLRILNRALISGQAPCRSLREWKEQENTFDATNRCPANRRLDVSSLFYDYVARIPVGYANISLVF